MQAMEFKKVILILSNTIRQTDTNFYHLPPGHGRQIAYDTLNNIRLFRNRVYHNEPICFNGNAIDFQKAEDTYQSIRDVFSWCDPELLLWIKDIDSVIAKINGAKKI